MTIIRPFLTLASACLILVLWSCSHVAPATINEQREATARTLLYLQDTTGLFEEPELETLIQRIVNRLSAAVYPTAVDFKLTAKDLNRLYSREFRVYVLNSKLPNAYSLGSGIVVITVGMLFETKTEAELAAVLAHEMAHQMLGHTADALDEVTAKADDYPSLPTPKTFYSLPREKQADSVSLKLLQLAHYNPAAALQSISISFRSNHSIESSNPAIQTSLTLRIANLEQELSQYDLTFPGTENSREFTRVRKRLFRLR